MPDCSTIVSIKPCMAGKGPVPINPSIQRFRPTSLTVGNVEILSLNDHEAMLPLRGCLKSWSTYQAAEHESGHSRVDPGFGGFRQCFIILAQSPAPAHPGESALHHPAPGQHLKAVAVPRAPHYPQSPTRQCRHPLDQLSGLAAIRPDQAQPGKPSGQLANDQLGPIPVLHVGWVHHHRQQQSLGIHHNMPFAAFHLLARVVPPRPPFSVVFTHWLSMMAPLGLGWRPRNRRIVGSRAS